MDFPGQVQDIFFPARHTPTVAAPIWPIPSWCFHAAKAVRTPWLEGAFLRASLKAVKALGQLDAEQATSLGTLFSAAYRELTSQPAYRGVKSALPYCFARRPNRQGHAFLYMPEFADSRSPVIVLLHGFGGNLLFQLYAIVSEFPDAIIFAPSWELAWTNGSSDHRLALIEDGLQEASKRLGFPLPRPWLFGISQGGVAAFEIVSLKPRMFCGLVGISTCAMASESVCAEDQLTVRIVHGTADDRISIHDARATIAELLARKIDAKIGELVEADHFLLLSHRQKLGMWLRSELPVLAR